MELSVTVGVELLPDVVIGEVASPRSDSEVGVSAPEDVLDADSVMVGV